jgi:hypothetical protein
MFWHSSHRVRQSDYTSRRRLKRQCQPGRHPRAAAGRTVNARGKVMNDSDEFAAMSDPDFLAERRRVRETLDALAERYRLINIEFDRRAGVAWASVS